MYYVKSISFESWIMIGWLVVVVVDSISTLKSTDVLVHVNDGDDKNNINNNTNKK